MLAVTFATGCAEMKPKHFGAKHVCGFSPALSRSVTTIPAPPGNTAGRKNWAALRARCCFGASAAWRLKEKVELMCGIVGFSEAKSGKPSTEQRTLLQRMCGVIAHRG